MPFPKVERVFYEKSPLKSVICQLRFPPILIIDSSLPSVFQERLRKSFPLYQERFEVMQDQLTPFSISAQQQTSEEIKKAITTKNHFFSTEDGSWHVNLTRTFVSLSTTKYSKWEEFREMLIHPYEALMEAYSPPFFTRIGLRYTDIFDRSELGLTDVPWSELLSSPFIGLLCSEVESEIRSFEGKYEIGLDDKISMLRMINRYIEKLPSREKCFLVDGDFFYPKRADVRAYSDILSFLHDHATRLIRFIILERLHEAMEPRDL